ncbi:MAG: DUF1499 domain-containing protein [Acetobacteraceae bacterium]|nr:DUF1499 domain-containing protein [Acetobacteraceae bacterium]
MTLLAWLVGLALPACGADGIAGLPMPMPMDMTKIERPATPNTFLSGPRGTRPEPDEVTAEWNMPAAALYDSVRVVFVRQPRTFVAAEFPEQRQLHYVVRSALINYPDLVTVQVNSVDATHSTLVVWSRSVYGRKDFGVNRERTETWFAALRQSDKK